MVAGLHPLSIFKREFLSRTVETLAPRHALTVTTEASQRSAVELMCKERIGSVLVTRSNIDVVGIITERDVLNKWGDTAWDREAPISSLMSPNPQVMKRNASIARVVHLMSEGGYRHVPIIYGATDKPRIISSKDFVDVIHKRLTSKILEPDNQIALDDNLVDQFFGETVEILNPDPPLILSSSKSVADALQMLRERRKGAVVTVDKNRKINGIFTERDYLLKIALEHRDPNKILLVEKITGNPRTLPTTSSIAIGFGLLSDGGYRHIPLVSEGERFVGMLSVRNFLSYLSASILATLEAEKR